MNKQKNATQLKDIAIPTAQTETTINTKMTRKAAEADIPQGPVKNQNKSGGGFSRDN
jgi:hypothetical protein